MCSTVVKPQKPSDVAKSVVWRHCSTCWENVWWDISCTGTGFRENSPSYSNCNKLDRKFIQHRKNVRDNMHTRCFCFRVWHLGWCCKDWKTLSICTFIHRYNTYDSALAHAIETQVINWTNLIQKTLKEDSSDQILMTGCNPGPSAELDFWASRNSNIKHIYHQVCSTFLQVLSGCII